MKKQQTTGIGSRKRLYGVLGALGMVGLLMLAMMRMLAPSLLHDLSERVLGTRGRLRLATAHPSGAYHAFGKHLAAAGKRNNLEIQLRATEGSRENLQLLRDGHADLALIQGALPIDHTGVTGLARLRDQYVHLVARHDGPIRVVQDLGGRRLAVGGKQSGFASVAEQLVAFYRMKTPPEFVYMPVHAMGEALSTGRVDAALTVYSLFAPAIEQLLATGHNRLVPLTHTTALARCHPGMTPAEIPDGAYGAERTEPIESLPTVSVPTLLVARTGLGGGYVRAVLGTVFGVEFRSRANIPGLTEADARSFQGVNPHSAARGYYSRNAPISSDRFEIASFFIAALLAMASLLRYLQGRRQARVLEERRERITPYFERLLENGERIADSDDTESLAEMVREMMRTQHQAEREWLQGRLDTEHMENLYAVFDVRCRNAFDKISKLQSGTSKSSSATPDD